MTGRLGPRFAAEASFIVLAAIAAGAAKLDPIGIVLVMALAWLAVAGIELVLSRDRAKQEEGVEGAPALAGGSTLDRAPRAGIGQALQSFFQRRSAEHPPVETLPLPPEPVEIPQHVRVLPQATPAATQQPSPAPTFAQPVATSPATSAPLTPAAAGAGPPDLAPSPEPVVERPPPAPVAAPPAQPLVPSEAPVKDEPAVPGPDERAVETLPPVVPEPTPQASAPAVFEPAPAQSAPSVPAPVADAATTPPPPLAAAPELPPVAAEPVHAPTPGVLAFTPRDEGPREWNLWDLETRAREQAGGDPIRDEEWSYLLMYLREFANADGVLPVDFDGLVRESFADLIVAGRQ